MPKVEKTRGLNLPGTPRTTPRPVAGYLHFTFTSKILNSPADYTCVHAHPVWGVCSPRDSGLCCCTFTIDWQQVLLKISTTQPTRCKIPQTGLTLTMSQGESLKLECLHFNYPQKQQRLHSAFGKSLCTEATVRDFKICHPRCVVN